MNTLPLDVRKSLFRDKNHYLHFRQRWSLLTNSPASARSLGPEHYLLYIALRGRDWRRAFTPITNRKKIQNGALGGWGLMKAFYPVVWSRSVDTLLQPFEGLVTKEMVGSLREMLPSGVKGFDVPEAYTTAGVSRLVGDLGTAGA